MKSSSKGRSAPQWELELQGRLPLFGHRNWIVIADAAYPHQSAPGIVTVTADAAQLEVVRRVLEWISRSGHIKAHVYVDRELDYVDERDANGITTYREKLAILLKRVEIQKAPHEEIIARLDQQARTFSVLIIKTTMALPYTSVFIELQCGYWCAVAESRLRAAIPAD